MMFSHTTKGQFYNMELLSRFLDCHDIGDTNLRPRLIDYELLTDDDGKRTVGFGWHAGGNAIIIDSHYFSNKRIHILRLHIVAGALESLSATAHAHLAMGIASPFIVSVVTFFVSLTLLSVP